MKVSGTSILTRKTLVNRQFGAEAWRVFFRDMALSQPFFRQPLTAGSQVPMLEFLRFHDELVRRFYGDRPAALFELGAESARWVLVDGPLRDFVQDAEMQSLVELLPKLWHRYFVETESRSEVTLHGTGVEFRVRDLPVCHEYFEHFVIGYTKEMLELYCANPIRALRQSHEHDTSYCYLFATDPLSSSSQVRVATSERKEPRRARALTERELEVLRFVGAGKTNREIASLLNISDKTVQHHIAHAYDKLGIYSRSGATLWLNERGLLC
jgi:DNA-binding CsgD family transcriptional regulator